MFPNIKGFENAIVAFDHMKVKFSECDEICEIMPNLEDIFQQYYGSKT
jgi:hypothetical protein